MTRGSARELLETSLARVDVVAMLLHRRYWHGLRAWDRVVECISLLTDASPNCGEELQGTIAVITERGGHILDLTFPGSSLSYGNADSISKGMASV